MAEKEKETLKSRLRHYTCEYLGTLCEYNHLELKDLKSKEDRINALADLPKLSEPDPALDKMVAGKSKSHTPVKLKEMTKLTSADDIHYWFKTFENLAKRYQIPVAEHAQVLEPYLTGPAQQAYFALSQEDQQKYSVVKEAVLRRYQLTSNPYRTKFRRETKQHSETFIDFVARLEDYAFYWLKPSEELRKNSEYSAIQNKIVTDQFLSTIRDETLRLKLVEKDDMGARDLAKLADDFVMQRRIIREEKKDDKSSIQVDRPKFAKFEKSKTSDSNEKKHDKTKQQRYSDACFKCGELGHKRKDCPQSHKKEDKPKREESVSFVSREQVCINHNSKLRPEAKEWIPRESHQPMFSPGPLVEIKVNEVETYGLVDSGASVTMVTSAFCSELGVKMKEADNITLRWFEGSTFTPSGVVFLDIWCGGASYCVECVVVESMLAPILLGQSFIYKVGLTMDFASREYWISSVKPSIKWPLFGMGPPEEEKSEKCNDSQLTSTPLVTVDEERRGLAIQDLMTQFSDVIRDKPGKTRVLEHEIVLREGTEPIKQRPYNLSPEKHKAAEEQVKDMLRNGIIEESKSPWRSPVVMVPKSDKSRQRYRLCVDFRKVNAQTKPYSYPMRNIHTILSSFHGAKFFSTLDMKTGFFQVYLRKEDREVTAFSLGRNLYQFKVLPMGVRNGPSTFQRLMDKVLGKSGLLGHVCEVLIDDIIVFSVTWEEHIQHLKKVLECLREAGLTTSIEKSRFFLTEADYLGHGVSESGIFTDGAKVEAIRNYPSPRDRRELDRFLGMVGWFSKFIPNCATISEPLYNLRRKSVKFIWNDDCEKAFLELKGKLSSAPCLAHPDPTGTFELHTDASGVGVGACLNQIQNGILKPIGCSSRTLNLAERNYSATEREILAVVWALEKWRPYIEGKHVVVVTDHMALTWIFTTKTNLSPRLYRWVLRVQEFDIEVKYRKGKLHVVPDALSRDHRFDPVLSIGVIDIDTGDDCDHIRCLKPTTEIIDWIQCDQCLKWFHDECVGVDPELAEGLNFQCDKCKCTNSVHPADVNSAPLPNFERSTGMKLVEMDQLSHLQRDDPNLKKLIDYLDDPIGVGGFVFS
ncbi:hypothetical protein HOLleu_42921 [Holothuria leucospilota]|uniref:RNA-directed DNA polymerase n=1 Tax=Holothuria leucospilota TaxID=206669 RepID=A0A9Q1B974_HOLLE|nr:hypothetical protein HOLleu_42921 [Holothuria leucospilota]